MAYDDDAYDDTLDPEGPSAEDVARFNREGSDCPACGSEVYDDAAVCPICGELLTASNPGPNIFVMIVVGVVLLAFVLFLVP